MSSIVNHTNKYIIIFIIILCFICALTLSLLTISLKTPQVKSEMLFRSKQMLIAAKILDPYGSFILPSENGKYVFAKHDNGKLVATSKKTKATASEILSIYNKQIKPFLVNKKGEVTTFERLNIDQSSFIKNYYKKRDQRNWYLAYKILSNDSNSSPQGYVFPVSGYGLWAPIYGYIALANDGDHVIGISWYQQTETPGLGANIANYKWQKQFYNKVVFQPDKEGVTDFENARLGIIVVKGRASDVFGNNPQQQNAIDGISGATLTGMGVMRAYQTSLAPYRNFLIELNENKIR